MGKSAAENAGKAVAVNAIKCIGKVLVLIGIGSVAGALLLAAVFLVPVNPTNKAQAFALLEKEGWYPLATEHKQEFSDYFHSFYPDVMDNNTDKIMISTALDENEGNPLARAMNMYSEYLGYNYSRYWHGYVVVLRPLFCFLDYSQIRILNGALQLLLMCALAHLVWQKKGMRYAVLMLTSFVLLMPQALAVSFQFSWVFYVGALGCLVLIRKPDYWGESSRYIYLFTVLGMLSSYFDLLTYPLVTWGIPVIWWFLTEKAPTGKGRYLERCVASGISWAVGYVGIWAMKWLLGSVITGENVIADAVGKVQEHAASAEGSSFTLFNRLEAAYTNWKHYEYPVYMLILIGWLVWLVVQSFRKGLHFRRSNFGLLLVAATSPAWYFVLAEHTAGHHFFTYRIWNVAVLAVLAILLQAVEQTVAGKKLVTLGFWAVAALCGGLLALTARETLQVHNGGAETVEVQLTTASCIEATFVPTFSKITQIGTIFYADEPNGVCEIAVSKDGEVLYQEQIPMEQFAESAYSAIEVDWRLKARESYDMTIRLAGATGEVGTALTLPGMMPLNEFQNVIVDGQDVGGQPIVGLNYHCLPMSKLTILYLACWFGCGVAVVLLGAAGLLVDKRVRKQVLEAKK